MKPSLQQLFGWLFYFPDTLALKILFLVLLDVNLRIIKFGKMKKQQISSLIKVIPPNGGEDLGGRYE